MGDDNSIIETLLLMFVFSITSTLSQILSKSENETIDTATANLDLVDTAYDLYQLAYSVAVAAETLNKEVQGTSDPITVDKEYYNNTTNTIVEFADLAFFSYSEAYLAYVNNKLDTEKITKYYEETKTNTFNCVTTFFVLNQSFLKELKQ